MIKHIKHIKTHEIINDTNREVTLVNNDFTLKLPNKVKVSSTFPDFLYVLFHWETK